MNSKLSKKLWSTQEKAHLNIGYQLGASLKTMSIVLNRSEAALNKALGRLGIRQYGANKRGKKSKAEKFFMVTPQIFRDQITAYDHKICVLQSQKNYMAMTEKEDHESKLNFYPNPWITFPERQAQPLSVWSDLDSIIVYLRKKGHKIDRYKGKIQILGGVRIEYCLDGLPMSAAQLLVFANRLRLEQGLEPFYVESITEN